MYPYRYFCTLFAFLLVSLQLVYADIPVVYNVLPNAGTITGGETVLVTGSGFRNARSVQFGTANALQFTILSDTSLSVVTPPTFSPGHIDIRVTTAQGISVIQPDTANMYPVYSTQYTYQGDRLAYVTTVNNGVLPINLNTRQIGVFIPVENGPTSVTITPNGKMAYVVNTLSNSITPIDLITHSPLQSIAVGLEPKCLIISPDGHTGYVVNAGDHTVTPIALSSNQIGVAFNTDNSPQAIVLNADATLAFVACKDSNTVNRIDLLTNSVTSLCVGNKPTALAISPNGHTIYTVNSQDNTISILDVNTGLVTATVAVGNNPQGIAITTDGLTAYVTNTNDHTITPVDLVTLLTAAPLYVEAQPTSISLSTDNTRAYIIHANATIISQLALDQLEFPASIIDIGTIDIGTLATHLAVVPDHTPATAWNATANGLTPFFDTANSVSPMETSTQQLVTGQTASRSGDALATLMQHVDLANYANNSHLSLDQANVIDPPSPLQVFPGNGPPAGGNQVTISGNNFVAGNPIVPGSTASFGGVNAPALPSSGTTEFTVTVPAGLGTVDVVVTNPDGQTGTLTNGYTYLTVNRVSPDSGPLVGNTPFTISGTGFTPNYPYSITFGTNTVIATAATATTISGFTPIGPNSLNNNVRVLITLQNSSTIAALGGYTYVASLPSVTSVTGPTPITQNSPIVINGANFTYASQVSFVSTTLPQVNVTSANFIVNAAGTSITLNVPANVQGTVNVAVTSLAGRSTLSTANQITVVTLPSVTSVTGPTPITQNSPIVINGTNFTNATEVSFVSANFPQVNVTSPSFIISAAGTSITLNVPANVQGSVDVIVTTSAGSSTASSADQITVVPPPTVTGITGPTPFTQNSPIVINGTNFTNANEVSFVSATLPQVNVTSADFTVNTTGTSITLYVPTDVQGSVDVIVMTPAGSSTASSADQITIVNTPVITNISGTLPAATGTPLTINGTNFLGVTSATFVSPSGTITIPIVPSQISADGMSISVILPGPTPTAPQGLNGLTTVTVANAIEFSAPSNPFIVTQLPVIQPPTRVHGHQIKNKFATQTDIINVIGWHTPISGEIPVYYRVYRDSHLHSLVAEISGNHMKVKDHHRHKDTVYSYYIVSVDRAGAMSSPAVITINPKK